MKSKIQNLKGRESAKTLVGLLLILAVVGLLFAMLLPDKAKAVELSPPVALSQSVGTGAVDTSIGLLKNNSFLVSTYAGIMITNSGASVLVTNDYGLTNLTGYIRQSPGVVLPPGVLYTNALINPYFWMLDGQAAVYQAKTGVRLWKDIDIPVNAGTLAGYSNVVFYMQQSGATSTTTNQNTFVLLHSVDGRLFDTNDTWRTTGPPCTGTNVNGTNVVVPISFLTGFRKARLYQIIAGTNSASTSNYVHDLGLSGVSAF